ncbi:MAG: PKD domain-containing protein, partial [Bacteroidota bacterium]
MRGLWLWFILLASPVMAQLPVDTDGLDLWVRGDSAMDLGGSRVVTWYDLSGNDNNLTQEVNNFRPFWMDDALNGHRGVYFNGNQSVMTFPQIETARTVFWVVAEDDDALGFRPVLGDDDGFPFFRGPEQNIWHPEFTAPEVLNGTTRLGSAEVDGLNTDFREGYELMSVVTTGDVEVSQFGQDRNQNRFWKGTLLELIIFNVALTEEEVILMENHLAEYYSAPLPAIEDQISQDNFCPVAFDLPEEFDYQWSNGAQDNPIELVASGDYWVDIEDPFGRVMRDSLTIVFPGNLNLPLDTMICAGEPFVWDLELDNEEFDILWSDGSTESISQIEDEDIAFAQVTDGNGCTANTSELVILYNNLDDELSISDMADLCEGNILTPSTNGQMLVSLTWQDNLDQPNYVVTTSEEVTLEVVDDMGCTGRDTLEVNLIGLAPQLSLVGNGVFCENEGVTLAMEVESEDAIIGYEWMLGGEVLSNTDELFVELLNGDYSLEYTATTDVGCFGTAQDMVLVAPVPEVQISTDLACEGQSTTLIAMIDSVNLVSDVIWLLDGQQLEGLLVEPVTEASGFLSGNVQVNTIDNCSVPVDFTLNVAAGPEIEFSNEGVCVGTLSSFESEVVTSNESGELVSLEWDFGDEGNSSQPSPVHLYTEAGLYEVELAAMMSTGCVFAIAMPLQIYPEPDVSIPSLSSCVDVSFEPVLLYDGSSGEITQYQWEVEELGSFAIANPNLTFTETDFYTVELDVVTENGCEGTASSVYSIFPAPQALFSFFPEVGEAPFEVQLNNNSLNSNEFDWVFGNGEVSDETNPMVVFEENGTYEITLTSSNDAGCVSVFTSQIEVTSPEVDLSIENLVITPQGDWCQVDVLISNRGNITSQGHAVELFNG